MLFAWIARVAVAGDIYGSKHDLSVAGAGPIKNDSSIVCYYCHGVHAPRSQSTLGSYVMWNRDLDSLGPYTLYSSDSLDSSVSQPKTKTLACLSCHDGTVAVNVIKGGNVIPWNGEESPSLSGTPSDLETDLSDDHPVSFTYVPSVDANLKSLEDATNSGIEFYGAAEFECGSCHDAHDPDFVPFLRISNAGSALCFACHIK